MIINALWITAAVAIFCIIIYVSYSLGYFKACSESQEIFNQLNQIIDEIKIEIDLINKKNNHEDNNVKPN